MPRTTARTATLRPELGKSQPLFAVAVTVQVGSLPTRTGLVRYTAASPPPTPAASQPASPFARPPAHPCRPGSSTFAASSKGPPTKATRQTGLLAAEPAASPAARERERERERQKHDTASPCALPAPGNSRAFKGARIVPGCAPRPSSPPPPGSSFVVSVAASNPLRPCS